MVTNLHSMGHQSYDLFKQLFCKTCYGRKFGPAGYGFGMGAGVLSTDKENDSTAVSDAKRASITSIPGGMTFSWTASFPWQVKAKIHYFLDATRHLYERLCPSVRRYFRTPNMAIYGGEK